jgi:predicted nucleic acid-binding protein
MHEVMVDTSAWIEFFRSGDGPTSDVIAGLLSEGKAALCGVVEMELLQGVRPKERATLAELLEALLYVDVEREDFIAAGELLGSLRLAGKLIPATDALIGACCIRRGMALLTLDRHFDAIPELARFAR